jgi:cobalt-zinc-cadmium efflux system outer membrane protein
MLRLILTITLGFSFFIKSSQAEDTKTPAPEAVSTPDSQPVPSAPAEPAPIAMSLKEIETIFFRDNLELIASKYGVQAEAGKITQAGLWANPDFWVSQSAYNQFTKRVLDVTTTGQSDVQLSQTIPLAGRIQKAVDVAKANSMSKQEGFLDTVRLLRNDLRSTYFKLHFKSEILKFYEESLVHLRETLNVVEKNFQIGNITVMEVMRIRSVVFKVEGQRTKAFIEYSSLSNDMKLFLSNPFINFKTVMLKTVELKPLISKIPNSQTAVEEALINRPDLKSVEYAYKSNLYDTRLQKAQAYPNLKIGAEWDRKANYIKDYTGLLVAVEIPIFDRNQGNIAAAVAREKESSARLELMKMRIQNDIRQAFVEHQSNEEIFSKYSSKFEDGFTKLAEILNNNYQKRYINSLEFSDSFDSLRETVEMYLSLQIDRFKSAENLNSAIGKEVIELAEITSEK